MQVYLAVISHPFINQRMKNLTTVIEIDSLIFMENFNYAPHYLQILLKKLLFKKRLIIILLRILITVKSNQYFIDISIFQYFNILIFQYFNISIF
jgi:hypothetical protein